MKLLVDRGAAIDQVCPGCTHQYGSTPFFIACGEGFLDVVKYLLKNGSKAIDQPHARTDFTPLMIASQNGHEAVVCQLIERGVAIEHATNNGYTSLIAASQEGHEPVVRLLLERGVAIEHATNNGYTSLIAASQEGHEPVVRLLLERGAVVDHATNRGATALWIASYKGQEAVVRLLIERGAMIDRADNHGATSLCMASYKGQEAVVRLLLERGAVVDHATNRGATALWIATSQGHLPVVKYLLESGSKAANTANKIGLTPLMKASGKNFRKIAKLLQHYGAKDFGKGKTCSALSIAKQRGHLKLVVDLKRRRARKTCDFCGKKSEHNLDRCGWCKGPAYCNKVCQKGHWKTYHKEECKTVQRHPSKSY